MEKTNFQINYGCTNFGKKKTKKSYTFTGIIHLKYVWEFSHDPFSSNHARSVKTNFIAD